MDCLNVNLVAEEISHVPCEAQHVVHRCVGVMHLLAAIRLPSLCKVP